MNGKAPRRSRRASKMTPKPPLITLTTSSQVEDQRAAPYFQAPASDTLSATDSTVNCRSRAGTTTTDPQGFQPLMSSTDAYMLSTTRLNMESEEHRTNRTRLIAAKLAQTSPQALGATENTRVMSSRSAERRSVVDMDSYLPLPEHSNPIGASPIKSRRDFDIHQSTIKVYERHASASARTMAIHCLQEASFFKSKSWLKQVELSKEMVKHQVHRRIRQGTPVSRPKSTAVPLRATMANIPLTSTTIPVQ